MAQRAFVPSEPYFIIKRTGRYCCLWMSWAFLVPLSILRILAVLLRSDSTPWCREGVGERCFRWYAAEYWCCWWAFYVYPRVPPSYAGGWIWRCLRCLWRLCSASFLSFCCMKKADPVSSKCLYRCLRVLAVFVCIIIIANKMRFVKIFTHFPKHRTSYIGCSCGLLMMSTPWELLELIWEKCLQLTKNALLKSTKRELAPTKPNAKNYTL